MDAMDVLSWGKQQCQEKNSFGNKTSANRNLSLKVFEQKLNYIHNNPVESGFVTNPIDWKYSSAKIIAITTNCFYDRFELIDSGYELEA
jgi:hypothetical protein